MATSDRTIKWIENLADQELLIKAGERVSIDILSTKDEVLAVETASFVRDLLYHFDYLTRLFNGRVNQSTLQIKLQRPDNQDSFSLVRNSLRLNISLRQPGVVQFQCDKKQSDSLTSGSRVSMMFSGMVEAKFGTFHDVEWYFLGNRVSAEQVARHYLTEFIQVSRAISEA
jgi:hypothetical protein